MHGGGAWPGGGPRLHAVVGTPSPLVPGAGSGLRGAMGMGADPARPSPRPAPLRSRGRALWAVPTCPEPLLGARPRSPFRRGRVRTSTGPRNK